MTKGIGGHQRAYRGKTDVYLTPREILEALGGFDLDPCHLPCRPWDTAKQHFTEADDGLSKEWAGRVWLNPPYGPETGKWLSRLADHGNGIALVFARTETEMFHRYVWGEADAILFLEGRLHFHHADGSRCPFNAGGPSCLVAYGAKNLVALQRSKIKGRLVMTYERIGK